jgi:hypothetical protein
MVKTVRLFIFLLVPLVLLILPATYFDDGKSMCISILLLGKECYACGMTRAIMHLIHLDFADAIYFNPISIVVFPFLVFIWAKSFWKDWQNYRNRQMN